LSRELSDSGMPRLQSYKSMKLVYNECTFGIRLH